MSTSSRASPGFKMWSQLAAGKFEVLTLPLCKVLLNDDKTWPWLVLVPQQDDLVEMHDLSDEDQLQLMKEISACSKAVDSGWSPTKVNVAAIGFSRLGCEDDEHVRLRFTTSRCTVRVQVSTLRRRPGPVWGATKAVPYPEDGVERDATVAKFKEEIAKNISF